MTTTPQRPIQPGDRAPGFSLPASEQLARECGVDLEITGLDPAAVALAPMEQEDWGE